MRDRKSTRLNSSHTEIYTLSLHDALPILEVSRLVTASICSERANPSLSLIAPSPEEMSGVVDARSEEHTSELQSHRDLHSFPTRRSSDLGGEPAGHRIDLQRTRQPFAVADRTVTRGDVRGR